MPSSLPNGSRKAAQCESRLASATVTFAMSHIIRPAGAATAAALPRTNRVRSNTERTITLPICGRRYGGSSSVNDDGIPFNIVSDNSRETAKVISIPSKITAVSARADSAVSNTPALPIKNIVMSVMIAGNRPLHGTKLLVSIAISRSLGESIMRQPTTPAALQPKPMHMERLKYAVSVHFLIFKYISSL